MAGKRMLVVGAHHDDCEWKAGGLSLLLKERGWQVRFLVLSNTATGFDPEHVKTDAARQVKNAQKAARIMGIAKEILGFPSHDLPAHRHEIVMALAERVQAFNPHVLVCDWPRSGHEDHRAAGAAALEAARRVARDSGPSYKSRLAEVYCYHAYTYGEVRQDFCVHIGKHWRTILRALKCFPEFENPRGNNLILSKEHYLVAGDMHWEHVEPFQLLKADPRRVTMLTAVLKGDFWWYDTLPPREIVI